MPYLTMYLTPFSYSYMESDILLRRKKIIRLISALNKKQKMQQGIFYILQKGRKCF